MSNAKREDMIEAMKEFIERKGVSSSKEVAGTRPGVLNDGEWGMES